MKINGELNTDFNECLINRYRTGEDYIGFHSDNEKELSNGIVAGISLGQERTMVLKRKDGTKEIKFILPHGSLFVMESNTQKIWLHGIPKELSKSNERISLTFRQFK